MAIPPFDHPREHHANLGRLLTTGGGWLVAAAAVAALILVLVKDTVPWTVLRAHLPKVSWDKQAGPKQSVRPKQEPSKPITPDVPREVSKSETPLPPVAQPPIRCEDSEDADSAAAVPQQSAPVQSTPASPAPTFEAASVMKRVAPSYPRLAREHRIEGQVLLRASVGTDGRVRKVEIVEGNPILAQAAADAMRQWRYAPARLDGVPVPSVVMTAMRFEFAA